MQPTTRRIVVALVAAFVVVMLVASAMGTAGAHDELGDVAVEVLSAPDDPSTITIRTRITYSDDGHPVEEGAVVSFVVTPTGGDDRPETQGDMARVGDGQYEATVTIEAPGDYSVVVTSQNPEGSATVAHTVVASTPTTTTSTPSDDDASDAGEDDSDEVVISWPIVIAGLVFLVAVAGLIVVAVRRRAS